MIAARSPFDEAAAFVDLFLRSDWKSCHLRGGGIELFVAREPGHANPLLGPIVDDGTDNVASPVEETVLIAPHLGTLVELATIGTRIAPGQRYGVIELLGESRDLVATRGGTMWRHLGRIGDLVEYDQPLAAIC